MSVWFDVFTVGAVQMTVVWDTTLHPLAHLPVSCRHSEQRCPAGLQPALLRFTHVVAQGHKPLFYARNIYGGGKDATLGCVRPKKDITSKVDVTLSVVSIVASSTCSLTVNTSSVLSIRYIFDASF